VLAHPPCLSRKEIDYVLTLDLGDHGLLSLLSSR